MLILYLNSSNNSINFNEINAIENWRGRGRNEDIESLFKEKTKELIAYMESVPKLEMILNKKSTRSQSNTLLHNENATSCLRVSKQTILEQNTCSFDFVAAITTITYIDNPKYTQYLVFSANSFF